MAYKAYLTLDQPIWNNGDYSSSNKLTGTIYSDASKSTAYSLSGLTLTIRIFKRWQSRDYFSKTATIVSASAGTWEYAVGRGEMPQPGLYLIKIEMSSSGNQVSTFPEEFEILEGPHA